MPSIHTKQGIYSITDEYADDPISNALVYKGEFEWELMQATFPIIRDLTGIRQGDGTLLDIGANIGVICIGALIAGEFEQAIAVEPDKTNFARLNHNITLNGLRERITCVNAAVTYSNEVPLVPFEISPTHRGDHRVRFQSPSEHCIYQERNRHVEAVCTTTIDELLEGQSDVAAIWMDVQGHEGYALLGGLERLQRLPIPVVCEVWPYGLHYSGLGTDAFVDLTEVVWTHYWARERNTGRFIKHPINDLATLIKNLGYTGHHTNVIFWRE